MKQILSLLFIFTIVYAHTRECNHSDLDSYYEKIYEEQQKNQYFQNRQRNLQSTPQAQQIRVTVDYSTLGNGLTSSQRQYLIKLTEIARGYIQRLLKVNPTIGRNTFSRSWGSRCIDIDVPAPDLQYGVANSDLHLYTIFTNSGSENYIANAGFCSISDTFQRPNFGRVKFNLANMGPFGGDSGAFENNLETTIHEIIHILGFSGSAIKYWIDPSTGYPYGNNVGKITKKKNVRGRDATILFSKNVLETTRKYYNCPNAEGQQLENEGGSGSMGAHWEKTVNVYELMAPSAGYKDRQLSVFTIALLKDTGYYAEVNENMSDNIYWGNGQGCEFLNNACYSKQQFNEFPQNTQSTQCSFEYDGIGVGQSDKFTDNCYVVRPYSNMVCTDPKNSYQGNQGLQYFGYDSKCFQSTASNSSFMQTSSLRCHKFKCSDDKQQIKIIFPQINKEVICQISQQGQKVSIDPSTPNYGQIVCPYNFQRFCTFTPICPNACSENGVCVKGYCICNQGYGNVDCSSKCDGKVENNQCVTSCSQGNVANPDNTCKSSCPAAYYVKNGQCEPCHSSCSSCLDEKPTSCLSCQFLTFLQNGSCVSQCSQGYVLNDKGVCINNSVINACKVPNCALCDTSSNLKCIQCSPNFFITQSFTCDKQCSQDQFANTQNGKCESCALYLDDCIKCANQTTCVACGSNKIIVNGKCQDKTPTPQCPANCAQCENSTKCIQCQAGFFIDSSYNCTKQCQTGQFPNTESQICENCNIYIGGCLSCTSKSQCTSCEQSKVLENGKCIDPKSQCPLNCRQCENPNKCWTCNKGFFLDYKYQCVLQCYPGQFANPNSGMCENCNLYISGCQFCDDQTKCTQCENGKQLSQGKCAAVNNGCSTNCSTCESFDKCTKCSQKFYLDYQLKCVSQCHPGQFANAASQWCENCNLYISGCTQCDNSTKCTQCENGKQLSLGKCVETCAANCVTCNASNKCIKCAKGFFLDYKYQCVTQCYQGQFANQQSGMCENCNLYISNCQLCDSATNCTQCESPKVVSSGKCVDPCPSNCAVCDNQQKCTKCNPGLFLDHKQNCLSQCYYGQFGNTAKQWCENCNVYLQGCLECTNQTTCVRCDNINGFVLNKNVCAKGRTLKENLQRTRL